MTTSTPQLSLPPLRLSGACACCGAPTGRLFSMGHDARFRGNLQRALATGDWDATVTWYTGPSESAPVTVAVALAAISALVGKDWTQRVSDGATRLSRRPHSAPPVSPGALLNPDASRPFVPAETSDVYLDGLMERLSAHPLTGQWGWFRPANRDGERFSARVQKTRRDSEQDSRIDLWCPELDPHLIELVSPVLWHRDEEAKL